ncbi:MAG: branched-chain amino acid ABC transporter permease [Xanthobacteraceae bacterium]
MTEVAATRAATPAWSWLAALRRHGLWLVAALLFLGLPLVFRSGTALTMMSLMGIMIVFASSYNMLLGQTGLLSFGHAVYYGLGAFFVVHAMNAIIRAKLPIPLPVMPLIGGTAGLVFAVIFGSVATRRGGTAFAMISLGLAELVASSSLILRSFFGGEEGITTNRTRLFRLFDWNFGPQIQVYYLIAAWCLISMIAIYALTRTPFGRMCNAVRENPERIEFIGCSRTMVRFIAFCLAGFFAGIAGGLAAINFEIVNASYVGLQQSGIVLIAAYIGGTGYFIGPVLGAILVTYLQIMLSDVTEIWQLYFGLMFIGVVMFAPGGLAGLLMMHVPLMRARVLHLLMVPYALLLAAASIAGVGAIVVVELTHRLAVKAIEGTAMRLFGILLDTESAWPWLVAAALAAGGGLLTRAAWPLAARALSDATAAARTGERS